MSQAPVTVRADAELVRILVSGGKLHMRRKIHRIYCKDNGEATTPGRPSEVVWLAWGLPRDWTVKIAEKRNSVDKNCLAKGPRYTLVAATNPVYSGKARRSGVRWGYDVTLYDDSGVEKHSIDPEVVIDPDP